MRRWFLHGLVGFFCACAAFCAQAQEAVSQGPGQPVACGGGFCRECGCKGGPGYRVKATGRCVSHKQLAATCGTPPDPLRCTAEAVGSVKPACATKP